MPGIRRAERQGNAGSVHNVRMRYGPDDEDAFFAARDELTTRFELSPGGHELGWVAAQVLDFKWGYLDGDLSRWEPEEVEEILLGLFPAKVMLDPDDLDHWLNANRRKSTSVAA